MMKRVAEPQMRVVLELAEPEEARTSESEAFEMSLTLGNRHHIDAI